MRVTELETIVKLIERQIVPDSELKGLSDEDNNEYLILTGRNEGLQAIINIIESLKQAESEEEINIRRLREFVVDITGIQICLYQAREGLQHHITANIDNHSEYYDHKIFLELESAVRSSESTLSTYANVIESALMKIKSVEIINPEHDESIVVKNYLEAAGVVQALNAGLHLDSLRRPMSDTVIRRK